MALAIGPENASSGMSRLIFVEMDRLLSPSLQQAVNDAGADAKPAAQEALDGARDGWRKLAFAIATGVIDHVVANMEIFDIETRGNVTTSVSGNTAGAAPAANHVHAVSLSGQANNVTFTQSNDGTGHAR